MDFTLKEMDSTTTQAPIPVTPEKQQEEVLFAYHENYTSDWYSELQDEEMTLYSWLRRTCISLVLY